MSGTGPDRRYTPNLDFHGSDRFTFSVNDGTLQSAPATVDITIGSVNDAPVANPQSIATDEDTPTNITLSGSDVEGSALTFAILSGPSHGALSGTAPNLTYIPAANFNGVDSLTFKVNDGNLGSASATVDITVRPVNDAPMADPQSLVTDEDTPTNITLSGSDVEGSALTFAILSGPSHGALNGTAPNLSYIPAANFNGTDSLTFKVNDGNLGSAPAIVGITVRPVNDAPVADPQSLVTNEDTPTNVTLSGSDVEGDALTFSILSGPSHGALTGTAPNLTYIPAANFNGVDSITLKSTTVT